MARTRTTRERLDHIERVMVGTPNSVLPLIEGSFRLNQILLYMVCSVADRVAKLDGGLGSVSEFAAADARRTLNLLAPPAPPRAPPPAATEPIPSSASEDGGADGDKPPPRTIH